MARPLVLLLLLVVGLSAAEAEAPAAGQDPWVKVDYVDHETGETHYYLARIAPADLSALAGPTPPTLVKLREVCWFLYNRDGDAYGVHPYQDESDSDTVFLATRLIERVCPQRVSPKAYLAAHPAEPDAEDDDAGGDDGREGPAEAPEALPQRKPRADDL